LKSQDGSAQAADSMPKILLVGNPNVGKSVLFNLLTGSYAVVSNYPGTTVEVTRGRLRGLGRRPEVVDTPGINTLTPLSLDELVTRDILLAETNYIVVQVIDARNLPRGLRITAELAELGVPVVVVLNMVDEALLEGIHISAEKLSDLLGVPVVPTVAVERRGLAEVFQAIKRPGRPRFHTHYPPALERAIGEVMALLPDLSVGKRGLAVMLLTGDEGIERWLAERAPAEVLEKIRAIRAQTEQFFSEPLDYVIAESQWQAAEQLAEAVSVRRKVSVSRARQVASSLTMHPVWGMLVLAVVLYAMYLIVGKFGAGTVVDFVSGSVVGSPAETVAALGLEKAPLLIEAEGAEVTVVSDTAEVTSGQAAAEKTLRVVPGPGAPRFLREGASYAVTGLLSAPGTAMPRVVVILNYPDDTSQRVLVPLVQRSAGRYNLQGSFSPRADGARYAVLFSVKGAREFTLAGLAVRREAEGLINPWIYSKTTQYLPPGFLRYLLVGEYGVITMGLTLALGVVLPIVAFFFLFFALLEDSGYLARLTVLADRLFKVMGLNGRAAVPMVLGLGCDTMATLAARVLESRRARLVVTFLLALGVPCSAQLGVVMSMASAIGPMALLLIFGLVLVELFAAGYVVSRIVGNTRTDFVVEIPLLRLPTVANVLRKTWQRSEWFLREALPYFLLGTGILAVFSWVGILGLLERLFRPVVVHWLSLPPEATYAFLIGFVRRDYGAAGLFDLRYDGRLDNLQTVVALITMTLFVPCIANFLVMIKEQGLKRAVAMVAAIIPLAVLTGGAVNWVLRALGVNLG